MGKQGGEGVEASENVKLEKKHEENGRGVIFSGLWSIFGLATW